MLNDEGWTRGFKAFGDIAVNRLFLIILTCLALGDSCEATLVIAVPNEEGMLILSDKLARNTLGEYSDGIIKVVRLSPHAAAAITGSAVFSLGENVGTNIVVRERVEGLDLAKHYFSTNSLENFNKAHFAACMSEQLSNYFAQIKYKLPDSKPTVTQFILFRTTPKKECLTFSVHVFTVQTESGIQMSAQSQQLMQPYNEPARIMAFGSTEVPSELMQAKDPRFDGLRREPVIAMFLRKPRKVRSVQLSEARLFARRVMVEAAAKTPLINPQSRIGTTVDETILVFK
jgi:hypothetical protein